MTLDPVSDVSEISIRGPQGVAEFKEILARGGTAVLTLATDVMKPLLNKGDRVRVRAATAEPLGCGDVVIALRNGRVVCRRLMWRSDATLWTKADALDEFDAPCSRTEVLGRVVAVERAEGKEQKLRVPAVIRMACLAKAAVHHICGGSD